MILHVLRHGLKHKPRLKLSLYLQASFTLQQSLHIKAELQQQAAAQSLAAEQMMLAAPWLSARSVSVFSAGRTRFLLHPVASFTHRNSSPLIVRSATCFFFFFFNHVSLIYSTPAGHHGQVGQNLFKLDEETYRFVLGAGSEIEWRSQPEAVRNTRPLHHQATRCNTTHKVKNTKFKPNALWIHLGKSP